MDLKVSVIIAAYNAEQTIAETLDSVLAQSYRNLEVVVINDGSNDKTLDILERYKSLDSRVSVYNQENQGMMKTKNRGISLAKGELVAAVDSDDLWPTNRLELQAKALTDKPNAIVLGAVERFRENSSGERIFYNKTSLPNFRLRSSYFSWLLKMPIHYMVHINTYLCRKEILIRDGLQNENYETAHDWDVWIRLAERYEFIHLPEVMQFYRKHEASDTSNRSIRGILKVHLKIANAIAGDTLPNLFKRLKYRRYRYEQIILILVYRQELWSALALFLKSILHSDMIFSVSGLKIIVGLAKALYVSFHSSIANLEKN